MKEACCPHCRESEQPCGQKSLSSGAAYAIASGLCYGPECSPGSHAPVGTKALSAAQPGAAERAGIESAPPRPRRILRYKKKSMLPAAELSATEAEFVLAKLDTLIDAPARR